MSLTKNTQECIRVLFIDKRRGYHKPEVDLPHSCFQNHGLETLTPLGIDVHITKSRAKQTANPQVTDSENVMKVKTLKINHSCNSTFVQINAHSVRNKSDIICDFIYENNLDLWALTETWLLPSDTVMPIQIAPPPPRYSIVYIFRHNQTGGGVA